MSCEPGSSELLNCEGEFHSAGRLRAPVAASVDCSSRRGLPHSGVPLTPSLATLALPRLNKPALPTRPRYLLAPDSCVSFKGPTGRQVASLHPLLWCRLV